MSVRLPPHLVEWVPYDRPDGITDAVRVHVAQMEDGRELMALETGYGDPASIDGLPAARTLRDRAVATYLARQDAEAQRAPGSHLHVEITEEHMVEARRTRTYNRLTRPMLEEVGRLYLEGGSELVSRVKHVGRRQANRYVSAAREAGVLG